MEVAKTSTRDKKSTLFSNTLGPTSFKDILKRRVSPAKATFTVMGRSGEEFWVDMIAVELSSCGGGVTISRLSSSSEAVVPARQTGVEDQLSLEGLSLWNSQR